MPKLKIPKSLGACADLLYDLKTKRLAAQKVAEAIEADEKAVKEHLINSISKSREGGAVGKHHKVLVGSKKIPQIEDPEKFYAYVAKNKAFDMLQRRLNEAAVLERMENARGKKLPGVKIFDAVTLSLTKV